MTPDAFSEQRRHGPPLALDPTRTAVIVVGLILDSGVLHSP